MDGDGLVTWMVHRWGSNMGRAVDMDMAGGVNVAGQGVQLGYSIVMELWCEVLVGAV